MCGFEGNVTNCYYLIGCATDGNGTLQYGIGNETLGSTTADVSGSTKGLTDAEMRQQSSFAGFDFDTVWTMEGDPGYPYPELIGMAHILSIHPYKAQMDAAKITHSCSLMSNLQLNYYVDATAVDGFDRFYLLITKEKYSGGTVTYETFTVEGEPYGSEYRFAFSGIPAAEMGDGVSAVLCGVKDGVTYERNADVYNLKTYAYNQLAKTADPTLRTLLVDLLNYCAEAQTYFGYRKDALVNADLTPEQQAWATAELKSVGKHDSVIPMSGATAFITGKSIICGNAIELKLYMKIDAYAGDLSNVAVEIAYTSVDGRSVRALVPGSTFGYDSSTTEYTLRFDGLSVSEARRVLNIRILYRGSQVSDTVIYSIETYVANRFEKSADASLKRLVACMMKYADSAYAYLH